MSRGVYMDIATGEAMQTYFSDPQKDNISWYKENIQQYSKYFYTSNEVDASRVATTKKFLALGGINKNPNQIIFVTNGLCMSSAGILANSLKLYEFGIFINFGKKFEQLCNCPGGQVLPPQLYQRSVKLILQNYSSIYSSEEIQYLKQMWLPTTGIVRMTNSKAFSFNMGEQPALQNIPTDFRTDIIADIVVDYFITIEDLEASKMLEIINNKVITNSIFSKSDYFGRICKIEDNVVYREKQGQCLKFGCILGYQKQYGFKQFACVHRTDVWNLENQKPEYKQENNNNTLTICLIVGIAAVTVVAIVLGLWVIKLIREQKLWSLKQPLLE